MLLQPYSRIQNGPARGIDPNIVLVRFKNIAFVPDAHIAGGVPVGIAEVQGYDQLRNAISKVLQNTYRVPYR